VKTRKRYDVTKMFVALRMFNLTSDISDFQTWLKENHGQMLDSSVLPGYKYFLETVYHLFFSSVEYDYTLGLSESEHFRRACFEAKIIGSFSPNCEKTIVLMNLHQKAKMFLRANNVDALKKEVDTFKQDTLSIFEVIISKAKFVKRNLSGKEFERCLIIGNVYLLFHQYGNSKTPYAHHTFLLGHRIKEEKLKHAMKGFSYSLQFLWYKLLKPNEIPKSIKSLHKAKGYTGHDNFGKKEAKIKIKFIKDAESFNPLLEDRRVDLRKRKDLDSFFWRVQRDIIQPYSQRVGYDIASLSDMVYLTSQPSKKMLSNLIIAPPYKRDRDLGEILLWYSAEFIHSRKSSMHMGIPTFITLLAGAIALKERHKVSEKIRALRFIHPHGSIEENEKNDYTYGVLINSYHRDNIYDKGWLLFFDSCGDYSGFSGSEQKQAEELISYYVKRGELDIETKKLGLYELEEFLGEQSIIYRNERELGVKVQTLEGRDRELKGFLFELFSSYYASQKYPDAKIIWSNGEDENNEIDVLLDHEKIIIAAECKLNPNSINLEKEIEKLQTKSKLLSQKRQVQVQVQFYFWKEPFGDQRKKLEQKGVNYEVLSLIARSKITVNPHIERLFSIFDEETRSFLDLHDLEIVD
jgi:hypothetical protein